jgi:hypothetical protein
MPYASAEVENVSPIPPNIHRVPRVVHAPSDANIKGTKLIIDALNVIRSEFDFELVIVQNRAHDEAMELYKGADIAIDQVLAGWYGGFAVEMMALGKPVMCWIREEDMTFVPNALRAEMPIRNIRPEKLVDDIRGVFKMREHWPEWSNASRDFVMKWHNPHIIAKALIKIYINSTTPFNLVFAETHANSSAPNPRTDFQRNGFA